MNEIEYYINWILYECEAPVSEIEYIINLVLNSNNAEQIKDILNDFKTPNN